MNGDLATLGIYTAGYAAQLFVCLYYLTASTQYVRMKMRWRRGKFRNVGEGRIGGGRAETKRREGRGRL